MVVLVICTEHAEHVIKSDCNLPSRHLSPKECSGKIALKYAILETATATSFFTNKVDCCSVSVSFGKIADHCFYKIKKNIIMVQIMYNHNSSSFDGCKFKWQTATEGTPKCNVNAVRSAIHLLAFQLLLKLTTRESYDMYNLSVGVIIR